MPRFRPILLMIPALLCACHGHRPDRHRVDVAPQSLVAGAFRVRWGPGLLAIGRLRAGHYEPILAPLPGKSLFTAIRGGLEHQENRGSFALRFAEAARCEQFEIASARPTPSGLLI